ncbi:MAG: FAD-binding oxidoreductase [Myxococcota bacterium]|nr:ferric reductase-like transmembrane domain-containing protein [Deltaproteobacteria bacterium]MDQ3335361.1 FAD-binding oxidoreductase [Myxococcota bacterium]
MSTSKLVDGTFLKRLVIINALVPALILAWDGYHDQLGVNAINFLIRTTGLLGLVFLTLSLLITPLRRLTGWNLAIAPRRQLGLFGFFYIATHFLIFWLYDRDGSFGDTLGEIIARPYLWFGFGALVLMIPLALTSLDTMITRLGPKRWKLLHRLNYVIVPAGVVHYYLLVKSDVRQPVAFGVVVALALLVRAIWHYLDLRRAAAKQPTVLSVKKKFWSGEMVVARIFVETHDVKTFRFVMPDGSALPFEHIAGQYLNIALMIDGKRVNRSYTIASSPTRSHYVEISVKRAPDGHASQFLHDQVTEGMRIKIGAPAGKFYFAGHGERVVMIAGGVGITPMMSVARSLTDRCWRGDIYLLFGVRERKDVIFEHELAQLQQRFPNLHVEIVPSSERGRITKEIVQAFVPGLSRGPVMLCGPDAMMTAIRKILVEIGVPDGEITQEAFVSPLQVIEQVPGEIATGEAANVQFKRAGKGTDTSELTILECAEACGVNIPFECRSGICGQCKTTLVSGKVTMDVQDALTSADRSKGVILACQARASNDVVVDA